MPKVNVNYRFEKDAVIDTIYQLTFQGKPADWAKARSGPNVYEGKVKEVYVSDEIEIIVELGGVKDGTWNLKVTITELEKDGTNPDGTPKYKEKGNPVTIDTDPIKGKLTTTYFYNDGIYKINF